MIILGIETSCDETAAAIVKDGTEIQSSVVASSQNMHKETGGIIPEQAAREQIKSILPVIQQALKIGKCKAEDIDSLAVTYGPGLIGSLLVGVETAKTLSLLWKKPLIPVNHLIGHIYANWLNSTPQLPAIALVVSGGHTDLILMKKHGEIQWLGGTRDDAAGEAFDKCARLLDLGYPGGPAISKSADKFFTNHQSPTPKLSLFPRPMIHTKDFDFSFSGLKTSVHNYLIHNSTTINPPALSAQIQEAICDVLVSKSIRATKKYQPKSFLLAGGVAANQRLRQKLNDALRHSSGDFGAVKFHVPETKLCTDNAGYIASAAFFNQKIISWKQLSPSPQLSISD